MPQGENRATLGERGWYQLVTQILRNRVRKADELASRTVFEDKPLPFFSVLLAFKEDGVLHNIRITPVCC